MEEMPDPKERIIIAVNAEESEDEDDDDVILHHILRGPQFDRENALEGEMRNVLAKRRRKSGTQSKICKKLFRSDT
jgi:hypothetical protein